jgi:hypothetical protein
LGEQELIQRACQESFLAARCSLLEHLRAVAAAPALLPVQEVVAATQPAHRRYSRSSRTPTNYSDGTRSADYSSTRWPLGRVVVDLFECGGVGVGGGRCVDR